MADNIKLDNIDKGIVDNKTKLKRFLTNNMVTIFFIMLGYIGFKLANISFPFFLSQLIERVARNSFLVLALIIPVMAGMGLNFAIVLGAMAGQIAIIMVVHWGYQGVQGIIICAIIATPIAILFGYLTGKLLNKTKGQEMITSLILGFFANGIYQFVFLILVGSVIPMENEELILSSGVGLRVTIALNDTIRYALDDIMQRPFTNVLFIASLIFFIVFLILLINDKMNNPNKFEQIKTKRYFNTILSLSLVILSIVLFISGSRVNNIQIPIVTFLVITALCFFIHFISKTKLGQDMKTVGNDMHIATASGINSNRIRIIAIIMSMVLAAWGQIIYLQNLGTLSTYGSHENIGLFAIAAILIGGASVTKATIGQAILGTILFHTVFIVSPMAGANLLGNAQLGEYFRVFVAYGVIALSLVMHAWKKHIQSKDKLGV